MHTILTGVAITWQRGSSYTNNHYACSVTVMYAGAYKECGFLHIHSCIFSIAARYMASLYIYAIPCTARKSVWLFTYRSVTLHTLGVSYISQPTLNSFIVCRYTFTYDRLCRHARTHASIAIHSWSCE